MSCNKRSFSQLQRLPSKQQLSQQHCKNRFTNSNTAIQKSVVVEVEICTLNTANLEYATENLYNGPCKCHLSGCTLAHIWIPLNL